MVEAKGSFLPFLQNQEEAGGSQVILGYARLLRRDTLWPKGPEGTHFKALP